MMEEITVLSLIVSAILSILTIFTRFKYKQVKVALNEIVDAIEDDKVTPDEMVKIVKAIRAILPK